MSCGNAGIWRPFSYNLIFAENGRRKTTLCAILRSLQSGDPAVAPQAAAYAQTATRVLQLIDEAVPGHRTFRRPGFDDPTPP